MFCKSTGAHYQYYESGNTKSIASAEASYKEFYEDGQPKIFSSDYYENGSQIVVYGNIKRWHRNGEKESEYKMNENRERIGEFQSWYANGKLKRHCFYGEDRDFPGLHGEFIEYDKEGRTLDHCFYTEGEWVEYAEPLKSKFKLKYDNFDFLPCISLTHDSIGDQL